MNSQGEGNENDLLYLDKLPPIGSSYVKVQGVDNMVEKGVEQSKQGDKETYSKPDKNANSPEKDLTQSTRYQVFRKIEFEAGQEEGERSEQVCFNLSSDSFYILVLKRLILLYLQNDSSVLPSSGKQSKVPSTTKSPTGFDSDNITMR